MPVNTQSLIISKSTELDWRYGKRRKSLTVFRLSFIWIAPCYRASLEKQTASYMTITLIYNAVAIGEVECAWVDFTGVRASVYQSVALSTTTLHARDYDHSNYRNMYWKRVKRKNLEGFCTSFVMGDVTRLNTFPDLMRKCFKMGLFKSECIFMTFYLCYVMYFFFDRMLYLMEDVLYPSGYNLTGKLIKHRYI